MGGSAQAEAAELLMDLKAVEDEKGTLKETRAALEAALAEAHERSEAAAAQLASERESAATLEKARAAAVQVHTGSQSIASNHQRLKLTSLNIVASGVRPPAQGIRSSAKVFETHVMSALSHVEGCGLCRMLEKCCRR